MDPELGRWLSLDPELGKLSAPQTMNRYVYCVNNPLRFTDPTGEWSFSKWWDKHWKTVAVVAIWAAAVVITAVSLGTAAPLTTILASMAIGSLSGGLTSTAIYQYTTPASQKSFAGYLGSFAAGATAGAAMGAAPFTGGYTAAFAVGAAGGLGGYISGQAIKGQSITVGGLLLSGGLGGASGAASFGLGSLLSGWYEKALESNDWAPLVPTVKNLDKVVAETDWTKVLAGIGISSSWSAGWTLVKGLASQSGLTKWGPSVRLTSIGTYSI